MLNRYVDRVLTAAEYDPAAVDQFVRVTALIDPATRLLRPSTIWRAARATQRRRLQRIDQRDAADGSGMPSPASTLRSSVG
jgi:hypothetical protein